MLRRLPALMVLLALGATPSCGQQVADTTFDTRVERPALAKRHPRVLFDEAHHNFHTASGRYRVFVELIGHDGCAVTPNREPFSEKRLSGFDVLVISNALGAEDMADSGPRGRARRLA